MTIGVLLMTHPGVGAALLHTATRIVGSTPLRIKCLEVPVGADVEPLLEQAAEQMVSLDQGDGVLVLSDLFGATPSNLACRLTDTGRAMVVAGLNLPMLLRVFNYPNDDLAALAGKASDGGVRGIHIYERCGNDAAGTIG
jgi:PTS system ascorbate-specific IIA component